ncbi:acyl-CoA thioesterase [Flagellimonas flava]|uniref:Acyl-CoA thioester hydrolase n=1 Tax=Flagellimonas flava TaxID=570519 RepID=A0A1M5IB39_9FLAO|nr:acyl-CoA thioesterase [Allomuricauda flava]SHG25445.1 acyl-CoA thioester hydrolase [Allomuricauda flava]
MQVYTEERTVAQHDLDALNHVNNVRYVEWIQSISESHWLTATDNAARKDLVWVVKNHNITYKRSAMLGDSLEIKTFIQETKGPLSIRVVEIRNNKTQQLLVYAITEWCLLDGVSLKPKRVPEAIQKLFG